ncbi:hypothetical protein D9M71_409150 [compost metagenome]
MPVLGQRIDLWLDVGDGLPRCRLHFVGTDLLLSNQVGQADGVELHIFTHLHCALP